jgi:hypothetical protein
VSAADSQTITVKSYVLEPTCAFSKGLSQPISMQCAASSAKAGSQLIFLAEGWNYLLAERRHHAIEWSESEDSTVCRRRGDSKRQGYKRGSSKAIVIDKIEAGNSKNRRFAEYKTER